VASSGQELRQGHDVVPKVDPHDEPSAQWGWHGTFPRGTQIAGWFIAAVMFFMMIGNQIGHVEDIFLGLTGGIIIVLQLLAIRRRRTSWRR